MKIRIKRLPNKRVEPDYMSMTFPKQTEADKAAEQKRIAEYKAFKAEWLKTNAGKYEPEVLEGAMCSAHHDIQKYHAAGKPAALIKVDWVWPLQQWLVSPYWGDCNPAPMHQMPTASAITFPFMLNRDGSDFINIRIESYKGKSTIGDPDENGNSTYLERKSRIDGKIGGTVFRGELVTDTSEMTAYFVVLQPGTPQEVADALAKAMHPIIDAYFPNDLPLLLQRAERCFYCNRPLSDAVSQILQVGPTCAKTLGVKHDHATAQEAVKRIELFWAEKKEAEAC